MRTGACVPGMYANVAIDYGERRQPDHGAADGHHLQPVRRHGVRRAARRPVDGKPRDTVEQRFVKLGATRGDQVAVLSGIKAGDEVVTAGQMKLRNGSSIVINNTVQPTDDAHPTPPNE